MIINEDKRIKELQNVITLRDKEILDIKNSIADVLQKIKYINESNFYEAPEVKRRKISEICTDTIYELLIDEKESSIDNQNNR